LGEIQFYVIAYASSFKTRHSVQTNPSVNIQKNIINIKIMRKDPLSHDQALETFTYERILFFSLDFSGNVLMCLAHLMSCFNCARARRHQYYVH